MNRILSLALLVLLVTPAAFKAEAQSNQLAPDQNPNYLVSQNRYTGMADSLTGTQSTTVQQTYKAIDYLEDKKEARALRRAWRQQNRYRSWGYSSDYFPYAGYDNFGYYNNYYNPWSARPYLNNFLFNTLPLAITLGSWHRHWR